MAELWVYMTSVGIDKREAEHANVSVPVRLYRLFDLALHHWWIDPALGQ